MGNAVVPSTWTATVTFCVLPGIIRWGDSGDCTVTRKSIWSNGIDIESSAVLVCGIVVVKVTVPVNFPGMSPLPPPPPPPPLLIGILAVTLCPAAGAATVAVGLPPPLHDVISAGFRGVQNAVTRRLPAGDALPVF